MPSTGAVPMMERHEPEPARYPMDSTSRRTCRLEIDGEVLELGPGQYRLSLCDLVSALLSEKEVSRATYVLAGSPDDLDDMSANLFRHLRQQRCTGPEYAELEGTAESFRIHSVVDALVAVHFYFSAGDVVPHFFVGHGKTDVLSCTDRGSRCRLRVEKAELRGRLRELAAPTD